MTLSPQKTVLWLILLGASVCGAVSFPLQAATVPLIAPLPLTAWRLSIAALLLLAYLAYRRQSVLLEHWRVYLWLGLLGNVLTQLLISWGIKTVPSSVTVLLVTTQPFMSALVAHWLFPGERLNLTMLGGFLCGFIGIVLLLQPSADMAALPLWAVTVILLGTACSALSITEMRRFQGIAVLPRVAGMLGASALVSWLLVLGAGMPLSSLDPLAAPLELLSLGAVLAAASILVAVLIDKGGLNLVGFSCYITPVLSVVVAAVFLNEPLRLNIIIALALVCAGLLIFEYGTKKRDAAPQG